MTDYEQDWTPKRPSLSTDTRNAVIINLYQHGVTQERIVRMMKNHCSEAVVSRVIGQYQRRQTRLIGSEK